MNSNSRILNLNFEFEFVPAVSSGLVESYNGGIRAWLIKFEFKGSTNIIENGKFRYRQGNKTL